MTAEEFAAFTEQVCADCDAALAELAASGCSPGNSSTSLALIATKSSFRLPAHGVVSS
jgi:hypothetical protein